MDLMCRRDWLEMEWCVDEMVFEVFGLEKGGFGWMNLWLGR